MGIRELAKPAGTWCIHCTPGRGCNIYGEHPPSCQEFACLWLVVPQIPDTLRPDASKVVLVMDAEGSRLMAHCDPADPLAWRREPVYSLLKQKARAAWNADVHVIAKAGTDYWLLSPTADLEMGRIESGSPYKIQRLINGDVVLSILPPPTAGPPFAPMTRALTARRVPR
jgi:hypothetical protein